jgi:hypothetical protein
LRGTSDQIAGPIWRPRFRVRGHCFPQRFRSTNRRNSP